jgi:soluble lytic murein transglycosylase-like protein
VSRRLLAASLAALAGGASLAEAQIYTRVNANGVVEATNVPDAPDFRLTYIGKGTLIHSRGFRRAYSGEYDSHILDASVAFGVSVDLIKAVIAVESEFDRLAVSSKGALGLMQLMPATARRYGVGDAFDARQNIFGGVQYLRFLLDLFQGNLPFVLAAYNAGENAVLRFGGVPPYKETRGYVQKVQALLSGVRALAFAPRRVAPPKGRSKILPARPKTYYKWRDDKGVLHVADEPPGEGTPYATIRALD